jgi:hypothetical protein
MAYHRKNNSRPIIPQILHPVVAWDDWDGFESLGRVVETLRIVYDSARYCDIRNLKDLCFAPAINGLVSRPVRRVPEGYSPLNGHVRYPGRWTVGMWMWTGCRSKEKLASGADVAVLAFTVSHRGVRR